MVREARFARADAGAAADDRRRGGTVVRRPERRHGDERLVGREQPGHRVDAGHLERRRSARAPAAGRAGAARASSCRFPAAPPAGGCARRRRRSRARAGRAPVLVRPRGRAAAEGRAHAAARSDRARARRGDRRRRRRGAGRNRLDAGQRGLRRRLARTEHVLEPHPPRSLSDGEHASDPTEATVERELPDGRVAVELVVRQLPRRREHRERNRQVVARPFLAKAGRERG